MRYKFEVVMDFPAEVSPNDAQEYVESALKSEMGSHVAFDKDPETGEEVFDPITAIDRDSIKVRIVETKKERCSYIDDRNPHDPMEFTESPEGERAKEKWAERYEECDGAPESDDDR